MIPRIDIKETYTRARRSPLFKDSFWALFGNAVGKGLSLLVGIIVANLLGSTDYGQYGMIKSPLIYMAIFSTFGLGVTGTKYVAQYINDKSTKVRFICNNIFKITLTTGLIMAFILVAFAEVIANFMEVPELSHLLRLSAVAVIFNAINSAQVGILAGFKAFKQISRNNIIAGVFNCVIGIVLTYFFHLEGAIISLSISYIFNCFINRLTLRNVLINYPGGESENPRVVIKEMVSFSFPIALQEGLQSISQWATIAVLVKLASYAELGIYNATGQWTAIVSFIPAVLKNVTLSYLSGGREEHSRTVRIMLIVNGVSSFSIFLAILLFSGIISGWYGESYVGLAPVLNLMILSCMFGSMGSVFIQELISRARNWSAFLVTFIKNCLILFFGYLFITIFTMTGAIAFATSSVVANILYFSSLLLIYHNSKNNE